MPEGKEQRSARSEVVLKVRRASKQAVTQHNGAYNAFKHKKRTHYLVSAF